MHVTNMKRSVAVCMFVMASFLTIMATVCGADQKFRTLELMRTYQSEEEYQRTNAKMLREKRPIVDDGESIKFFDPETGQLFKQMKKEKTRESIAFTEAERAKLANSSNTEPVVKDAMSYYIPKQGPSYLLVSEYEIKTYRLDGEGGPDYHIKNITLYNSRGERIMDMPSDTNLIASSPNKESFVAYYDGPDRIGEYLYFYEATGELLKKQQFAHARLKMTYSSNGEYIAMYSLVGKYFYIFTKQGELLFEGNYQDYAGKKAIFYGAFVSDDGNHILLSTSKKVFLLNLSGAKQWDISSPPTPISSAYFKLNRGVLYMSPLVSDTLYDASGFPADSLKIFVVNIDNGEILDEITDIIYYTLANDVLHVRKRGGNNYEYRIK